MKNYANFIGIDISKLKIDVAVFEVEKNKDSVKKSYVNFIFDNSPSGFQKMNRELKRIKNTAFNSFICMEHTGSYTTALCFWLEEKKWDYCLVSPLHLKRTLGLTRGKNDKVDAQRIAYFSYLYREKLQPTKLASTTLLKLKSLFAFRERTVKTSTILKQTLQEAKSLNKLINNKFVVKKTEKQLQIIQKELQEIMEEIATVMEEDEAIKKNFELLKTVVGIGKINALAFLVFTQNFTSFDNARQFNCYVGIAPFEHSSGSSVRGKTKISKLANKKMKVLLGNGVSSAIQHDKELKQYYERKIKEGKNKHSVKNAIKSKLVSRAFSVIKRQTPFVKFEHPMAA